jgi:outer membrane protein OmpA-like peptidoglycan-associated protein
VNLQRLLLCAVACGACSTLSPYRPIGDPSIDTPVDETLAALAPLERMEEALCSLHDQSDQARQLRGVVTLKDQKIAIDDRRLERMAPGLRGAVEKLEAGRKQIAELKKRAGDLASGLERARAKGGAGLSSRANARLRIAEDELAALDPRLAEVGRETGALIALAQNNTFWQRPTLCKSVETRRTARLVAASTDSGGGSARLLARVKAYEEILEQARAIGAERCAPKTLAEAEAQAEFARLEVRLGNWFKATAAAQRAGVLAVRTREEARPCAPKPKKPKKAVVVQRKDTDNDGVVDLEDKCPEVAGLVKYKGCPPPDADGDGFLDDEDKCPNEAEDFDGFQDTDGCPEEEDADADNDGILDKDDKCPTDPEDKDGFEDADGCPDRDNDADGVLDDTDKCPTVAEDRDGFEDIDGCPDLDNDQDGFPDERDACPNDKEDIDGFEDTDGCPEPDNDKDGIPDTKDRCPMEPETVNGVTDDDGCPDKKYTLIQVTKKAIKIKQKVKFKTGRYAILESSFPMLDQIADAVISNKIRKILVEGHTDDVGREASNMRLSQKRADAVRKYLVKKGVSTEALDAIGFGETRPLVDEKTRDARSANRRVEFKIIER